MESKNDKIIRNLSKEPDTISKLDKKQNEDRKFLIELAIKDPERLSYDKLLSNKSKEPSFIMDIVPMNKLAIKYMSYSLKEDSEFLSSLVKRYPGAMIEVLKNCNVKTDAEGRIVIDNEKVMFENQLYLQAKNTGMIMEPYSNNEKFMSAVIAKDATMILLVSEELKNDKSFIKVESLKNREVLKNVIDNIKDFGNEGLKGAKEANIEYTVMDSEQDFENRLNELKTKLLNEGMSKEDIDSNAEVKRLTRHIRQMQKFKNMSSNQKDRYMKRCKTIVKDKAEFFQEACQNDDKIEQELLTREENSKKSADFDDSEPEL